MPRIGCQGSHNQAYNSKLLDTGAPFDQIPNRDSIIRLLNIPWLDFTSLRHVPVEKQCSHRSIASAELANKDSERLTGDKEADEEP